MPFSEHPVTTRLEGGFVPALRDDFAREDIDGESVVWSPLRQDPSVLDPVSSVLLDVVDGTASLDEISRDVSEVVGVPGDVAAAQVWRCIGLLDSVGLLKTSTGADLSGSRREIFLTPPNT